MSEPLFEAVIIEEHPGATYPYRVVGHYFSNEIVLGQSSGYTAAERLARYYRRAREDYRTP
jgi:hypothetical protein